MVSARIEDARDAARANSSAAVIARGINKSYGAQRALAGLSVQVPRGALCGLIGPNGAGKTSLLSILATLDEDFEGEAHVAGIDVRAAPREVRARVGFVPDHTPLYEALSVEELLVFFAAASGIPRARRRHAIDEVVHFCGLEDLYRRASAGLSKGQTQRICVARALLHQPEVLLLDEPASGLDPRARIELKELLKRLAQAGRTVLVSSHILTELGDFCDHVLIMEHGRAIAAGPIDALSRDAWGGHDVPRRVLVELDRDAVAAEQVLRALGCVRDVMCEGNVASLVVSGARGEQTSIARALVEAGFGIVEIAAERQNLEALFLSVTQGKKSGVPAPGGER
jgi:ABC-2 type transport system ATP-binding protein